MNVSKKLTEAEGPLNPGGEIPIDPFAVDFFGVKPAAAGEIVLLPINSPKNKKPQKPQKKSEWYKNLPRLTNREAEFSFVLDSVPENLTEDAARLIAEAIARYTFRQPENVRCSVGSVSEVNLSEAVGQSGKAPRIFLTVGCQPENSPAVIAFETDFASRVIDLILGGQSAEFADPRNLSPIEYAIVEFLALNLLGETNQFLGEPLLCLQDVRDEPETPFAPDERGARVVLSLELEDFRGLMTLFVSRDFLGSLDKSRNSLLVRRTARKKLGDYEKIVPKLDLRVQVGTTFLDPDSLLFLEPEDIVLIEEPLISPANGNFGDKLLLTVGRGRNFRLSGTPSTANENGFQSGELTFKIGEILSEEARRKFTPAKFKMDEKENELAGTEFSSAERDEQIDEEAGQEIEDEQLSPALENVQIALRVEIAGNKLSLRELQNLRAGQIIALGCRPTDPVRLVTDHNEEPVATGELVEIEGQLGVRLTKVFI